MTGMKEGAGENPFAEETTTSSDERSEAESETQSDVSSEPETSEQKASSQQPMQIPYKFRRDGVKDGRDRVPLFLHDETKQAERDALREIENRFNDDVSLTDLREAVMKVGLRELDAVEGALEEWGYGMTFDD